jgi:hypothetical protein
MKIYSFEKNCTETRKLIDENKQNQLTESFVKFLKFVRKMGLDDAQIFHQSVNDGAQYFLVGVDFVVAKSAFVEAAANRRLAEMV